jgi:hypothetical protein
MNKKAFKLATEIGVFVVVTPIAWYVYAHHSGPAQLLFIAVLAALAYGVKKFFYEPLRDRLPPEDSK